MFLCNSLMGAKWVLCHVSKCAIVSTQLQSDKVALESPLKKYSKVLSGHQPLLEWLGQRKEAVPPSPSPPS